MTKSISDDAGKRSAPPPCSVPPVLDACCGSRMFWFDRQDTRAIFADKRRETHELTDKSSQGGIRTLTVNPDVLADFTALPWPDCTFAMVVFDPPHLLRAGSKGWQAKKYGKLPEDWQTMIRQGFSECFRVLRPEGTLIFKWNEHDIPVSQILALTPERPLVGQRCGKTARTHWIVFMKPNARVSGPTKRRVQMKNEKTNGTASVPRPRASDCSAWIPIATAPKDGTRILITNGTYVTCAKFGQYCDAVCDYKELPRWCAFDCEDIYYSWLIEETSPTHWMHIPKLPNSALSGAERTEHGIVGEVL